MNELQITLLSLIILLIAMISLFVVIIKKYKQDNSLSRKIINKLPLGVIIFDNKKKVIYQNQFAKNYNPKIIKCLLNKDPQCGLNISEYADLLPERISKNTAPQKCPLKELLTPKKSVVSVRKELVLKDEHNQCNIVLFTSFFLENSKTLLYFEDITQSKNEETLQKKEAYFEKMGHMGEIAGGIAHEINTPLCTLTLACENIKSLIEQEDIKEVAKYVSYISSATFKINEITQALRRYSEYKKIEGKLVHKNIIEVIDECIKLAELDIKNKGIDLTYNKSSNFFHGLTQPTLISQIIFNLIRNAKEAVLENNEKWIKINLDIINDGKESLRFVISDSGKKIPDQLASNIFNLNFTTKACDNGTGVGLHIVRESVQALGGSIKLDNNSKSTSFIVLLPKIASTKHSTSTKKAS